VPVTEAEMIRERIRSCMDTRSAIWEDYKGMYEQFCDAVNMEEVEIAREIAMDMDEIQDKQREILGQMAILEMKFSRMQTSIREKLLEHMEDDDDFEGTV